ncbi:MAG: carbohydrate-binding family 9-like protein [Bacteroidia bacterium]
MNAFLCSLIALTAFSPRHYICYQTSTPPQIDGKSEAVWDLVPWTESFVDIEGEGKLIPPYDTRLKMLWDEQGLYFLARLDEPHLQASLTESESVIFQDNDFEIFIDPDGDTHLYYEYEINALGTEWDLLMVKPYRDGGPAISAWDIEGVQSAVYLAGTLNDPSDRDQYWQVELFFPWRSLVECAPGKRIPRDQDQWRINFSRVQWQWDVRQGRYHKKIDPETGNRFSENNWVWSPQGKINMHMPEMWGYLQFSTQQAGRSEVTFVEDTDQEIKSLLRQYYQLQKNYLEENGRYADRLEMLTDGEIPLIKLQASALQYEFFSYSYEKRGYWFINQHGKIHFRPL